MGGEAETPTLYYVIYEQPLMMTIRWTDQALAVPAGGRSTEGLLSGCPPFKLGDY